MRKRTEFEQTSFFDMLFNMLLIFLVLFIVAFIQINPKAKKKDGIEMNEKFFIMVSWEDDANDDVDVYVKDPEDHLVYFSRREDGLMHLDRDDLGVSNDTITTYGGKQITVPKNEERVTLRGTMPGEYIVNVHMYTKRELKPTEVTVRLLQLWGGDTEVLGKTVTLAEDGNEGTAFRFTLDESGNITNTSFEFMSLYTFGQRRQ